MSLIFCGCGCGKQFEEFDSQGRKRKYIKGHYWKNKHHSEKARKNISIGHITKHCEWVGSRKYWRRQSLIRDDYTCQICGFRNVDIMIVDHKLPKSKYPELEFELDNLQTLCPNCNQIKTIKELRNKEYTRT